MIPYYSLAEDYLKALSFNSEQAGTLATLGTYKGRQELYAKQRPEAFEKLRQSALAESVLSSNRIEGIDFKDEDAHAILAGAKGGNHSAPNIAGYIAGYKDALDFIYKNFKEMPFTPDFILWLHNILFKIMPGGGVYKKETNCVVERDDAMAKASPDFHTLPPHLAPQAMEDLTSGYAEGKARGIDPLILIPLAVFDFLCILPFADGNERLARLMTTWLLLQEGYDVPSTISLERIADEMGQGYYDALGQSSIGWHESQHDVHPWLEFFWLVLRQAYEEFERKAKYILAPRGGKSAQVRAVVAKELELRFTIAEVEKFCPDIGHDTIRNVLRAMRSEGLIFSQGRGRGARWLKPPHPRYR